ncbi:division/cell wall cluster transcriptional repressor MraZ [Williamsoniiplasma lucivorax]|uniref:Transcriptional regulator MraZ n=1 Tax=Williamsoniiplasma lucivorax TaxID=209274 RepID=A0A2S5RDS2_9MOLU|nr:division/cell wall cluster transcriptional repressor MraZ [Williamsoniiplasma lucivorax]PPE05448.1 cell division protein MraZ [Williamsoniiplasma lucivorax]
MFLGLFEHSLDNKGRLTLPSKLRTKMNPVVYLSRGFEGSLEIRNEQEFLIWKEELEMLEPFKKDTRALMRYIFANSADLELDATGRIKIPANLLQVAKIDKDVYILGVGSKIEVWDRASYDQYEKDNFANIEAIAEKIDNVGE